MKLDNLSIKHDLQHQMFLTKVKGGYARLSYSKPQKNVLDFFETYVPEESRNKGVASSLATHALHFAEKQDLKVIPTCSFLKHFVKNNTNYENLTVSHAG